MAVIAAHGGRPGLRDHRLLESAVAAPQATANGKFLISGLVDVAAAYLFYICRNHPFVDGNKRTALVFLKVNENLPNPDLPESNTDAWEALVMEIADSSADRKAATRRLKILLRNGKHEKS